MNKLVASPDLASLLNLHKVDVLLSSNCHGIATIETFDPDTQTVTATMNYPQKINDKYVNYPVMVDCPIFILSGGTSYISMPIAPGDQALVCFNDRDIDKWFQTGQANQPLNTPRLHSFSDAIMLVGLKPLNASISDYETNKVKIKNKNAFITVGEDKLRLANSIRNFKDILDSLTDQLEELVTQTAAITVICATPGNPSSVPVNGVAIIAVGTQIATIATRFGELFE